MSTPGTMAYLQNPEPFEGRELDSRGFASYAKFRDGYGAKVHLKQSSAVDPHIWIFAHDPDGVSSAPHLTPEQAKQVIKGLQDWLEDIGEAT